MTPEQRAAIRAWMAVPENIGALYRMLAALPVADSFDPYMPPMFEAKQEMIALARTELDEAWDIAIDEIKGRLFTTTQILNAMRKVGTLAGTEWQKTARRLVPVRAFRLRDRGAKEWRIVYRKRQEILYAKTQADKAAFAEASLDVLIAELDITQVGLSSTEPESKAAAAVQQLVEQLSG